MADGDESKFRRRIEDADGGLAREEESRRRRPSAQGLALGDLEAVQDIGGLEFTPLADEVLGDRPDEQADGILPDFGLRRFLAEQRSEAARELLQRAHALMFEGPSRAALGLIEEALVVDPDSNEAGVLRGRCLADLGHHEAALRVLRLSRAKVTDPGLRVIILKAEAACIRAMTGALEEKLAPLIAERKLDDALALIQQGLVRQPSNIVFLHHLMNVYVSQGDMGRARATLDEARRHVGRETVDLVGEMERNIEFGAHKSSMDGAWASLRLGNVAAALKHLDACRSALEGNEHYDGLRAYADQKRRGSAYFLTSKGSAPSGALRQQTLRWLLSEELRQTDRAMRHGDFQRAERALEAASTIDPNCGAVLVKHARAIVMQCRRAMETQRQVNIAGALARLERAAEMSARAAVDEGLDDERSRLLDTIAELRRRLDASP
jgi:thioredoxin-like negative regulator of GroEL